MKHRYMSSPFPIFSLVYLQRHKFQTHTTLNRHVNVHITPQNSLTKRKNKKKTPKPQFFSFLPTKKRNEAKPNKSCIKSKNIQNMSSKNKNYTYLVTTLHPEFCFPFFSQLFSKPIYCIQSKR